MARMREREEERDEMSAMKTGVDGCEWQGNKYQPALQKDVRMSCGNKKKQEKVQIDGSNGGWGGAGAHPADVRHVSAPHLLSFSASRSCNPQLLLQLQLLSPGGRFHGEERGRLHLERGLITRSCLSTSARVKVVWNPHD